MTTDHPTYPKGQAVRFRPIIYDGRKWRPSKHAQPGVVRFTTDNAVAIMDGTGRVHSVHPDQVDVIA